MPNNLIRVKQLEQAELSGLVQNVIQSNEYTVTIGGTGININNVGLITISGTDIYLINSNISGYTGQFQALYVKGEPVVTGSAATASSLFQTGQNLYNYINALSGTLNNSGAILNSYINNLSGVSVLRYGNQTISGDKTFLDNINFSGTGIFNSLNLNNIDILSLSGVDITITSGAVTLTNPVSAPNLVYNIGNQTVSGVKTFISSGIFSLSGAAPFGLPNNPLSVVGSGNTYLQLNIQNRASGTNATADLVITANNGNDSSNFINLGINNSGYNDATFTNGTGYDGYLFINGGNLDIGTQTPNKYIEFHVGGTTENRTIARIDNSGINMLSGTYRVNNVPYNIFTTTFLSSNANLTIGHNYISNLGGGYSPTFSDRLVPIMENCTARKALITLLNGGAGNNIVGITGLFINTSTIPPQTGIINSSISAVVGSNQYTYTGAFSPPITISNGDNVVCSLNSNNTATNVRTSAAIYCYN